jgi:LacI family transcriptional regulator
MAEATIYDVATQAGVSIATVSHTINRPHRVNSETRRRVLEAIDQLGYVPKASAVAQARKSVGRVGVLAPFTSYSSYGRRLMGVLKEAEDGATEIVVYDQQSAASAASPLLSSLPVTRRLDGLLIMGLPLDDTLTERLLAQRLHTVLIDSIRPELDSITIDDEAAGHLAARHLVEQGRRTIGYVSESQRSTVYLSQGQRRRAGVTRALVEAGHDPTGLRQHKTTSDIDGGRAAVGAMLADGGLPDAVFAHHDLVAAGVLIECRHRGIRVPEDLAIIGFDDSELSQALEITTVAQPLEESGRLGLRQLHEAIAGASLTPRHVTLPVRLLVRSTS